jgi:hypothetical protein
MLAIWGIGFEAAKAFGKVKIIGLLCQPHISPWGEDIIQFFDPFDGGGMVKVDG